VSNSNLLIEPLPPGWKHHQFGELRKRVTFAICAELDDLERVTALVESLFATLDKASSL